MERRSLLGWKLRGEFDHSFLWTWENNASTHHNLKHGERHGEDEKISLVNELTKRTAQALDMTDCSVRILKQMQQSPRVIDTQIDTAIL
jgi:hypothetical protein